MKKGKIAIVVCGTLLLSSLNASIHAENFEGRESEMNAKCAVIKDINTQNKCRQYKSYLEGKSKNIDKEISDIKNQLAAVKGDGEKIVALIKKNDAQIANYEKQIAGIQSTIDKTQASIDELNIQIKEKTEDMKLRDKQMRERIIEMQPYIGSNSYIDFLMGSTSFTDLLRRTEIVGELNSYENEQIEILHKEKMKIDESKKIVVEQKDLLEIQKKDANDSKEKIVALNDVKKSLLVDIHKQEGELNYQKRVVQMAQANIPKIDTSLAASFDEEEETNTPTNPSNPEKPSNPAKPADPSKPEEPEKPIKPTKPTTNFQVPLAYGTWHYEAGTWQYPGGGGHMGMDFSTGTKMGIPVVAPADGIIIWTYNGNCDNNGGSACGVPWRGGNNTLLLTKKGNTIYAMPFYHLTSATKSAGTKVSQGEVIGYSGNSGYSFGAHCHVEVIRVGNMSMSAALSLYNSSGDVTFGTGWNENSPTRCDITGSAPCRERPESYWG